MSSFGPGQRREPWPSLQWRRPWVTWLLPDPPLSLLLIPSSLSPSGFLLVPTMVLIVFTHLFTTTYICLFVYYWRYFVLCHLIFFCEYEVYSRDVKSSGLFNSFSGFKRVRTKRIKIFFILIIICCVLITSWFNLVHTLL